MHDVFIMTMSYISLSLQLPDVAVGMNEIKPVVSSTNALFNSNNYPCSNRIVNCLIIFCTVDIIVLAETMSSGVALIMIQYA
jgi:hypothetical protein